MWEDLIRDGYTLDFSEDFSLPVFAWELDLEVRGESALTASQRAILRLVGAGLGTTQQLSLALGFGNDTRLVAGAATDLLSVAALAIADGRLVVTAAGTSMLSTTSMVKREHARQAVYFRPVDRQWSWRKPDRMANDVQWTVDWSRRVKTPTDVKDEIADLVAKDGVPELGDRSIGGVLGPVELVCLQQLQNSVAHERVTIERWAAPNGASEVFFGRRDGEIDPRLTAAIAGAKLNRKRRRLIVAAAS
jgi:hypothetical protein